jgi:hypothetical protein
MRRHATPPKTLRKLTREHFAFMRAVAQGLDERASWERYLAVPGERADTRTDTRNIRRDVALIRDAFAAAARREGRPGTARLVLIDPRLVVDSPALPSLDEFARERGLEDFSEQEQAEAFAEAFGPADVGRAEHARQSRRARLVSHQLEALRWLEHRVVQDPAPADPLAFWLPPALIEKLAALQIATVQQLFTYIDACGFHWFRKIQGVGVGKAARVVAWFQANEVALGLRLGPHVLAAPGELGEKDRDEVVSPAIGLVPLEKLLLPESYGGAALLGQVHEWIMSQRAAPTQRAYRKYAERLLLWATLVRERALAELGPEDIEAWLDFLAAPPTSWSGPRGGRRWSKAWRPLERAMSPGGRGRVRGIGRALVEVLSR